MKGWKFLLIILIPALFIISCSSTKQTKYTHNYEESSYSYASRNFKLKIPDRWEVKKYIKYYTRKDSRFIKQGLQRAQLYLPTIRKLFDEYGIPQDLAYLPLIESGFNPYAYSSSGAAGLWQFLPMTGRRFGLVINKKIDERRDPYKSSIAAAKYFKYLYSMFGRWDLVLAAYNCGEGCVKRKLKHKKQSFWDIKHKLPNQTKEYVPKFFGALVIAKNPKKYGIYINKKPIFIVRKTAKTTFHLKKLAKRYSLDYTELSLLNAHLKRKIAYKGTPVNIPVKKSYKVVKKTPTIDKVSLKYKVYRVKQGETLYRISKKFNVDMEKIKTINKLKTHHLKAGQILKIPVEE